MKDLSDFEDFFFFFFFFFFLMFDFVLKTLILQAFPTFTQANPSDYEDLNGEAFSMVYDASLYCYQFTETLPETTTGEYDMWVPVRLTR